MTNVIPLAQASSAEDVAAAWVARIDHGPLSAEERAELNAWLAADPGHAALLDQHAKAWAAALGQMARPTETVEERGSAVGRRQAFGALAASVAILATGGAWYLQAGSYSARLTTGPGESRTISLPDGSRLTLNTRTELEVEFDKQQRNLRLVQGEAIFAVAHDPRRPFEVRAGSTTTRAIGTRFAVRLFGADRVGVVVTEGRVQVTDVTQATPAAVQVDAGQRVVGMQSAPLTVAKVDEADLARATGWSEGGVSFRDEPLADVLAEVNRYADKPIRLANPTLGGIRVSGYFAIGNTAAFVSALSEGAGLRAAPADDGALVLSSG